MIDIEKFLVSLRSNKDLDGKLKPIYLADTVQEEIKIIQAAIENSRQEWVGLTDEEVINCFDSVAFGQVEDDLIINKHVNIFTAIHYIEAKLKEKNT